MYATFPHNYLTCYTVSLWRQTRCLHVGSCVGSLGFDHPVFCRCQPPCILIDSGVAFKKQRLLPPLLPPDEADKLALTRVRSAREPRAPRAAERGAKRWQHRRGGRARRPPNPAPCGHLHPTGSRPCFWGEDLRIERSPHMAGVHVYTGLRSPQHRVPRPGPFPES